MNKQNCPLCNLESEFIVHDHGKRKKFYCPNCKVFIITDTAERKLNTSMSAHKSAISEKCRILTDEYLMHIFVPSIETDIPLECQPELRSKFNME